MIKFTMDVLYVYSNGRCRSSGNRVCFAIGDMDPIRRTRNNRVHSAGVASIAMRYHMCFSHLSCRSCNYDIFIDRYSYSHWQNCIAGVIIVGLHSSRGRFYSRQNSNSAWKTSARIMQSEFSVLMLSNSQPVNRHQSLSAHRSIRRVCIPRSFDDG